MLRKLNIIGFHARPTGLTLDNKLKWHQHIHIIKNKIRPIVFPLRRLKYYLHPKSKLIPIYFPTSIT